MAWVTVEAKKSQTSVKIIISRNIIFTTMTGIGKEQLARLDEMYPKVDHTIIHDGSWASAMFEAGYYPSERTQRMRGMGDCWVGVAFEPNAREAVRKLKAF